MFCFWCESKSLPKRLADKGFVWLHLKCFEEIASFIEDLQAVKEFLEGKRKNDTVEQFLERMKRFDAKLKELQEILKEG